MRTIGLMIQMSIPTRITRISNRLKPSAISPRMSRSVSGMITSSVGTGTSFGACSQNYATSNAQRATMLRTIPATRLRSTPHFCMVSRGQQRSHHTSSPRRSRAVARCVSDAEENAEQYEPQRPTDVGDRHYRPCQGPAIAFVGADELQGAHKQGCANGQPEDAQPRREHGRREDRGGDEQRPESGQEVAEVLADPHAQ